MNKTDVERLTSLGLIMARGNSIALTPLGEQRVAQLLNNVLGAKPLDSNEQVKAMAKALGVKL